MRYKSTTEVGGEILSYNFKSDNVVCGCMLGGKEPKQE